jgi:signal transduction histidine kinase
MGVHSYFGIPMISHAGETIGHICLLGEEPLAESDKAESYLKIFSARAAAELERLQIEREIIQHRDNLKELVDEQTATLRQAKEVAESANRAKSEFLARMTFELKTPLSTVLGYAALLHEGEEALTESQQKFINNIITAGWHLDHVIGEILDVSEIESGELVTKHSKCNVIECLSESIKVQELIAKQRGIKIGFLYDTKADLNIFADRSRVIQIFSNLINNAIKFNRDNGLVKIKIEPVDDKKIRISISDTGEGVSEQDQQKVFEKFERLSENDGWITGTGVGLAITKRLVEYMGGQIGIQSVPEEGSTFWVEFNSI